MGKLFDSLKSMVADGAYVVSEHASERLEERGIMEWQVEVRAQLPDGTEFKAIWSHLRQSKVAKLVTVHFFD
jgi:hypothetical protein